MGDYLLNKRLGESSHFSWAISSLILSLILFLMIYSRSVRLDGFVNCGI